jgi:hypothetical protein
MFQPHLRPDEIHQRTARREQLREIYENKLLGELIFSTEFNLCVRFGCTTCGGFEFYENVFRCVTGSRARFQTNRSFQRKVFSREIQEMILMELAKIDPPIELSVVLMEPARYLIHHAINTLGHLSYLQDLGDAFSERTIRKITADTWAETVLEQIYSHEKKKQERRKQRQNEETARQEHAALRRSEHQAVRSRLKAERDRIFRQKGQIPKLRDSTD